MTIRFATNVPVELRMRYLEGKPVESQFGGMQHMFSAEEGAFYVSETVGSILAEQFKKLGIREGEPIEITKAEVSKGNGRKGIEWQVAKVGFAPGEQPDGTIAAEKPAEPPSELERQLAASIEQVAQRKAAAQAQAATQAPQWAQTLLVQTNMLSDVYAAALAHASATHGNAVKPEDIRALMTTAFINLSKGGSSRAA